MKNNRHWKDKLDEAGSFSYAPAGKALAWQKLNARLGEKKRRKKAAWYWVAAACLLPLITYVLLFRNESGQPSVTTNITYTPSVTKPSMDIKQKREEAVVAPPVQQPVIKKTEPQKAEQKQEMATVAFHRIPTVVDSPAASIISDIITPKDSNNNMASVAPPQKSKLKVVHINELNEPAESVPVMAHNYPKFLPLQMASETIYPEPAKAVDKTSFVNLKRKSIN